jgi:hypothetical protein
MIGITDDRYHSPKVQAGLAIKNPRSAWRQFFFKCSKPGKYALTSAKVGFMPDRGMNPTMIPLPVQNRSAASGD